MKWILGGLAALIALCAGLFWWLLVGFSAAPASATGVFDISDWRQRIADTPGPRPTAINVLEIGRDTMPGFAAVAGNFDSRWVASYNSVQVVYPDRTLVIGGAVDKATAEDMKQDEADWAFDEAAYRQLTVAMLSADQVLMTHEHLDHVMAIARHPDPDALAPRLVLNAPQIVALPAFASGVLAPSLQRLQPRLTDGPQMVAPGVLVVPAPGHTPGSQVVFITLQDGTEYLLIGDIVWSMEAVRRLKTRPVLTQFVVFDPNENRDAIRTQVRALHDLMAANPDIIVLPSHDRVWLQQLVDDGKIGWGFSD